MLTAVSGKSPLSLDFPSDEAKHARCLGASGPGKPTRLPSEAQFVGSEASLGVGCQNALCPPASGFWAPPLSANNVGERHSRTPCLTARQAHGLARCSVRWLDSRDRVDRTDVDPRLARTTDLQKIAIFCRFSLVFRFARFASRRSVAKAFDPRFCPVASSSGARSQAF